MSEHSDFEGEQKAYSSFKIEKRRDSKSKPDSIEHIVVVVGVGKAFVSVNTT